MDELAEVRVFHKVGQELKALLDMGWVLQRLFHPSLQTSGANCGLASVQNVEQCLVAAQYLLLHLLGEYLQGLDRRVVQPHIHFEIDLLQVHLALIGGIPLQLQLLDQPLQHGHVATAACLFQVVLQWVHQQKSQWLLVVAFGLATDLLVVDILQLLLQLFLFGVELRHVYEQLEGYT